MEKFKSKALKMEIRITSETVTFFVDCLQYFWEGSTYEGGSKSFENDAAKTEQGTTLALTLEKYN